MKVCSADPLETADMATLLPEQQRIQQTPQFGTPVSASIVEPYPFAIL